uniref:Asteroid domain-containing protein n=1 Tax=Anopheles christyi TaxID=43041 RepID=A0A182KFR0_9DIPT
MGIRHLQTFMERKVNGGLYTVKMEQEISKAKKSVDKPLIVVDLMALFGLFCSDRRSLLCGSQVWVVERTAETFFKRLTDSGAELVFFYDGTLQQNKYDTWISRQNDKYDRMIDILEGIDARMTLAVAADKFDRTMPSNTCIKLENVARQHGKLFISTDVECDQALAIYATKHKALAVISHDTDFLIYEGSWQLWHANHIDVKTLITKAYCKQALLRTLNLQWRQMAIWATLAGNDFFKYDELEPFLNDLGQHSQKFYKLADYVRRLPLRNKKLDDDTRKLQLWRWVCSDDLIDVEDYNTVPPALMCTVLTLYRLRQYGVIRMFEADLLLLIAQQLSASVFDPQQEPYPQRLISRAFRLGFLFQKVYSHMARVCKALGLPQEYRPSPPYDGHRFHNMYRVWTSMKVEAHHIESVAEWRFYIDAKST